MVLVPEGQHDGSQARGAWNHEENGGRFKSLSVRNGAKFDLPCRANKILKSSRHAFSVLRRWPRMSWSLERLIKGGDVTGECDAGTPGSDGASPYRWDGLFSS
jgi:hypothetical protein